jgi:hypothetical protein
MKLSGLFKWLSPQAEEPHRCKWCGSTNEPGLVGYECSTCGHNPNTAPSDNQTRIEGLTWDECKRILDTIDGNWHQADLTPEQERAVAAHYLFEMH